MNRTSTRMGRVPRTIAASAFVLGLSLTGLAGRATASPVANENEGCRTFAQARNESVHRLHEAWSGFRGELNDLIHEARDVQHAARKAATTTLALEVRDDLSDAREKLDAIWTQAHAELQAKAEPGTACTSPLGGQVSASLEGQVWTIHPAGRGPRARASWTNLGELDAGGTGTQALYMQKMNDSSSPGIAVVVIRGLSGQPVSALEALSWDRPNLPAAGSYCATSPHWQISVTSAGTTTTVPFGSCFAQTHTGPNAAGWQTDTCAGPCLGGLPDGTINSLEIIFEDGIDMGPGFVLLDNIMVTTNTIGIHTWTSASDNATASIHRGATVAFADEVSDVADLLGLSKDEQIVDQAIKDMRAVMDDVKGVVTEIVSAAATEDTADTATTQDHRTTAEENASKRSENEHAKPDGSSKQTENEHGKPVGSAKPVGAGKVPRR